MHSAIGRGAPEWRDRLREYANRVSSLREETDSIRPAWPGEAVELEILRSVESLEDYRASMGEIWAFILADQVWGPLNGQVEQGVRGIMSGIEWLR